MRTLLLPLLCLALTGCPRLLYLDVHPTRHVRCLILEVQVNTAPSSAWDDCVAAVQQALREWEGEVPRP